MPWTAAAFLAGSVAISALPPLNGFVSEWLTFQSLIFLGSYIEGPLAPFGASVAAALLALTGGLAAFCFVKAFAVAFLGVPRSGAIKQASEVGWPMALGMAQLTVLCMLFGLVPDLILRLLDPVTRSLTSGAMPSADTSFAVAVSPAGSYSPAAVGAALVALSLLALVLGRLIGGPTRSRVSAPWVCGIRLDPAMQYTSTALAKPIRIIFRSLIRPYREIERGYAQAPYFVSSVRYESGVKPLFERYLYRFALGAVMKTAHQVRVIQSGQLWLYLAYMFATLVVALLLTR
jgi:hydrogenase-4 component B